MILTPPENNHWVPRHWRNVGWSSCNMQMVSSCALLYFACSQSNNQPWWTLSISCTNHKRNATPGVQQGNLFFWNFCIDNNRELAMRNCQTLCPALYHAKLNPYSESFALFVNERNYCQGKAQHKATTSLWQWVVSQFFHWKKVENERILERWWADDRPVAGKFENMRQDLDNVSK